VRGGAPASVSTNDRPWGAQQTLQDDRRLVVFWLHRPSLPLFGKEEVFLTDAAIGSTMSSSRSRQGFGPLRERRILHANETS
jgi:hypothetical protein